MTTTQINVQGVSVTRAQFVKVYRDAEKRATVSAGGLAFLEQDRLTLNAMRVALGYDFTQAADAVSESPADYARHWQRFQHWAKQIASGTIRVAPEADYIADRTHKNARRGGKGANTKRHEQTEQAPVKETQETKHHLGMVFSSREEAMAHLKAVAYGLVRVGVDSVDAVVPELQANMMLAKQNLELEATAATIVKALEKTGLPANDTNRILALALELMPTA